MQCRKCKGKDFRSRAKDRYGVQMFQCQKCGYRATAKNMTKEKTIKPTICKNCNKQYSDGLYAKSLCTKCYYQIYYLLQKLKTNK